MQQVLMLQILQPASPYLNLTGFLLAGTDGGPFVCKPQIELRLS